jgi:diguanylate cyclase (GGDEF)-like protein
MTSALIPGEERTHLSKMLPQVVNVMSLGLILVDAERTVLLWNNWMRQRCSVAVSEPVGVNLEAVFSDGLPGALGIAIGNALKYGLPSLLSNALHGAVLPLFDHKKGGDHPERIQQSIHVLPLKGDGGERYCVLQISDVSASVVRERKLRAQAETLKEQAFTDGLTGLMNRRHFDERFPLEFRRAKRQQSPLSLVMLDIDFFKAYNDQYGHPNADKVLITVAQTLRATLPQSVEVIARYGGEEFIVVLPDCDDSEAGILGEKLRAAIENMQIPHASSDVAGFVTISVGLVSLTPDAASSEHLMLASVDAALYIAKHKGRNRVSSPARP